MQSHLLVFLGFLCFSQAYVSPMLYYIFGDLLPNSVLLDSTSQIMGIYTMTYDGSSNVLAYEISSNLQGVGNIELRGPASCKAGSSAQIYDPSQDQCIINTGPLLYTFGQGRAITNTQTNFQTFKGTLTLSSVEEAMLFNGELYILVYSATAGTGSQVIYTPFLRGNMGVFSYDYSWTNYPTYYYSNNYFFFVLSFTNNDGSFPGESTSSSQSLGHGLLYFQVQNDQIQNDFFTAKIYTTIDTPGTYFLRCGGVSTTLNNNQNNPNPLSTTLTNLASTYFMELFAPNHCFVFITSSAYPNGDLFAWVTPIGNMGASLTGASEPTAVQSPYYGYGLFTFDYGSKILYTYGYHNITTQITQTFVEFANQTMICNITNLMTPIPCQLNDSAVPYFSGGQAYLNIYTVANPNGELRGQIQFLGANAKSYSLSSTSLPASNSLAVGLGVGLGIGIPLLIAVGIFFLVKRRGSSKL